MFATNPISSENKFGGTVFDLLGDISILTLGGSSFSLFYLPFPTGWVWGEKEGAWCGGLIESGEDFWHSVTHTQSESGKGYKKELR